LLDTSADFIDDILIQDYPASDQSFLFIKAYFPEQAQIRRFCSGCILADAV
jgi:hypothetical protein